jgi:hypothetical protein
VHQQGKIGINVPQMFQTTCPGTPPWDGMGEYFTPSTLTYLPLMVKHDVYAPIAWGETGFVVFSMRNRACFNMYTDYYNAYTAAVRQIHDNGLDDVFTKGVVGDAFATITSGASTVTYRQNGILMGTYKSISVREWLYGGKTYLLIVNSSENPVTTTIDYIPNGTYTDLFGSGTISSTPTGCSGPSCNKISVDMPYFGVKMYRSN